MNTNNTAPGPQSRRLLARQDATIGNSMDISKISKSTPSNTYYRRACFTLNNWTQEEYTAITSLAVTWMVVGKECGDEGTPHLQGAVLFKTQMRLSKLRTMLGWKRCYIRPMYAAPECSLTYCSKEDLNPFVVGTLPTPGKRTDLHAAIEAMQDGVTMRELVADVGHAATYARYSSGLTRYRNLAITPRTTRPRVFWIWGPTGTGKTEKCVEKAVELNGGEFWISSGSLEWFDGYDGQRTAILDDFRPKHCTFSFLLRLLDKYAFKVPFKGGFMEWVPDLIFITAPLPPSEMFNLSGEGDIQQLLRRILNVVEFKAKEPNTIGCGSLSDVLRGSNGVISSSVSEGDEPVVNQLIDLTIEGDTDDVSDDSSDSSDESGISIGEAARYLNGMKTMRPMEEDSEEEPNKFSKRRRILDDDDFPPTPDPSSPIGDDSISSNEVRRNVLKGRLFTEMQELIKKREELATENPIKDHYK